MVTSGESWESDGARWFDLDAVPTLGLHPSLRADWPQVLAALRE